MKTLQNFSPYGFFSNGLQQFQGQFQCSFERYQTMNKGLI